MHTSSEEAEQETAAAQTVSADADMTASELSSRQGVGQTSENATDADARQDESPALAASFRAANAAAATDAQTTAQTEPTEARHAKRVIGKQTAIEYVKRTIALVIGLFIMSFGVGLSIRADLGTSPVSSIPYVLNIITELSVGTTTIIVNVIIVLLQIVLLRKRFRPLQLLQIPVCIAFGLLCDLALACMPNLLPNTYWQQWLICAAGIVLVAFGVSIEVTANVTTLAGEGLSLAMCQLLPKVKFGYMKVCVDCSFVTIAVALSFIFLHRLAAVREGTVAAALFVGLLAKLFNKFMIPFGKLVFRPWKKSAAPATAEPQTKS